MAANLLLLASVAICIATLRTRKPLQREAIPRPNLPRRFCMTQKVRDQIRRTVGQRMPETGGILGGDAERGFVTRFYFDRTGIGTPVEYQPDTTVLEGIVNSWSQTGTDFLGFIHSHPGGLNVPSRGDELYAKRILDANAQLPYLLLMIVVHTRSRAAQIWTYLAHIEGGAFVVTPRPAAVVDGSALPLRIASRNVRTERGRSQVANDPPAATSRTIQKQFTRIDSAVDLDHLSQCRVIVAGVGGASQLILDLARSGVREFVAIDFDVVEEQNLATQAYRLSHIGAFKVDALFAELRDTVRNVAVVPISRRVQEISVDVFKLLAFGRIAGRDAPIETVVIAATDNFNAQRYLAEMAEALGVPIVSAQLYRDGEAGEVAFAVPGQTRHGIACRLRSRYEAYAAGHEAAGSSSGALMALRVAFGAFEYFVIMAILHHGTNHARWGDLLAALETGILPKSGWRLTLCQIWFQRITAQIQVFNLPTIPFGCHLIATEHAAPVTIT